MQQRGMENSDGGGGRGVWMAEEHVVISPEGFS